MLNKFRHATFKLGKCKDGTFQLACWTTRQNYYVAPTPHGRARPTRCLKKMVKALPMSRNYMFCFGAMAGTWKRALRVSPPLPPHHLHVCTLQR